MWSEYGITDTGREWFLQLKDITLQQAILSSLIKEK